MDREGSEALGLEWLNKSVRGYTNFGIANVQLVDMGEGDLPCAE